MSKKLLQSLVSVVAIAAGVGTYYWQHPCVIPGYLCERSELAAAAQQDAQDPRYISFQPAWLNQPANILYPAFAINKQVEGSVVLALVVNAEGKLVEKRVKASSSSVVLDQAALAAVDAFDFNVAAFGDVQFPFTKELKVTFKL